MWTQTRMLVTVGFVVGVNAVAVAQGGTGPGQWNRKVEAISVLPGPGGTHEIEAYFSVSASDLLTSTDLDTEMVIHVNGVPVHSESFDITGSPGNTGSPCDLCDDPDSCICHDNGTSVVCVCDIIITSGGTATPLTPGDEVMVLLRPAPGAVPEIEPADDLKMIGYLGDPVYWNRRVRSVRLQASGGAPAEAPDSFFDVWVELSVDANYDGALNLDGVLELRINGVPSGETPAATLDLDLGWNQCTGLPCNDTVACAQTIDGAEWGTCQPDDDAPVDCACQYHPVPDTVPDFVGIPLDPDDELVVILRPVPGALPELPGFPDDDDGVTCLGDTDGDGVINVTDLVNVILDWGCTSPPGPCIGDINADGETNVLDLVDLILAWGPCFAV